MSWGRGGRGGPERLLSVHQILKGVHVSGPTSAQESQRPGPRLCGYCNHLDVSFFSAEALTGLECAPKIVLVHLAHLSPSFEVGEDLSG